MVDGVGVITQDADYVLVWANVLLIVDYHVGVRNLRVLPLIGLFKCFLEPVVLLEARGHFAGVVAEDVVDFAAGHTVQNLGLHGLVRVALFKHDFVLVLVFRVERDKSEVILVAQVLIELEHMLHGFVLEKDAIELRVDDENDALFQDVMVAQILVDGPTLSPADF